MGYFKDRYIEELEREYNRLVDEEGVMPDRAYAQAGETVYNHFRTILTSPVDQADQQKDH